MRNLTVEQINEIQAAQIESLRVENYDLKLNLPQAIRQYSNEINIKTFGAIGDGIADDTAAIQLAFNSIQNNTKTRGAALYFPAGFYRITSKVSFTPNYRIKLVGIGTPQYNELGGSGSVIVWNGPSGGTAFEYNGGTSTKHNGPVIEGVSFYTTDLTTTFIRFRFVTHWTIKYCSFRNGGIALELDAGVNVFPNNDNAWGLWEQNIILDTALYGIKVTNGTYGFVMMGGDTQVAMNATGVYLDEYSQHVRLIGTKHDRGNPAIHIKGGHNSLIGVKIENATKGIVLERVPKRADGITDNLFSGLFNKIDANIVGWLGTETGITFGSGTAYTTVNLGHINLASSRVNNGASSYSGYINGVEVKQNQLSNVLVTNYNIGSTDAGGVYASGNGPIYTAGVNAPNVIVRPALGGALKIQSNDGTIDQTAFPANGVAYHRGTFDLVKQAATPANPAGNQGRLFTRDNGSGKIQLCALFPTGAVQVIVTEP